MLSIAVAFLAIAATVLADVLRTYHMLARGGHEANPIVAWFMQVLGDAWPLCKLPEVALIGILWAFAPRPIALIGLALMSAVTPSWSGKISRSRLVTARICGFFDELCLSGDVYLLIDMAVYSISSAVRFHEKGSAACRRSMHRRPPTEHPHRKVNSGANSSIGRWTGPSSKSWSVFANSKTSPISG
jgi:hypothetical protein